MNRNTTLAVLSALAQETRLDIFRLLVRAGHNGLAASAIARQLHVPASTCSFHLKELKQGGVLTCCRNGRSLCYRVDFTTVQSVLGYLMDACCIDACCTDVSPEDGLAPTLDVGYPSVPDSFP